MPNSPDLLSASTAVLALVTFGLVVVTSLIWRTTGKLGQNQEKQSHQIAEQQNFLASRIAQAQEKRESTYQCESLYMQIARAMLDDPDLLDLYWLSAEQDEGRAKDEKNFWAGLSVPKKKKFVLMEMNFNHIAFVSREYDAGRVDEPYYKQYKAWLITLLNMTCSPYCPRS